MVLMIPTLPHEIQDELDRLAQRYDQPLVRSIELNTAHPFDPINKSDRYGEVCMVLRRKNGRLLLMKKTFYPEGAYRLLTGGIQHGEGIQHALLREVHEETGLNVEIESFLAALDYRLQSDLSRPVFYSFAFFLNEVSGELGALDADEKVENFLEIDASELPLRAGYLEQIGSHYSHEIAGNWHDWGIFRAAIHYAVWDALRNQL
ncbi:NUDIX hydrolase [Ktedonosporobacter rubrisoli]|uniref:NUDIX hydrolase n=1 Tax=Ktedonosporobacter rubrisoli TaxID=2509675 RepID=A0A4P6K301_KTERU|nr:NUDIX hydrolase [Ktedonosporobacter rubrisoli]QBD81866.1 NUDIX hydrolase [Ktedonosporobacter rubrisoli]